MREYMYVCMHVCMYVLYAYIHMLMHLCMSICIYAYNTYMHTYIHIFNTIHTCIHTYKVSFPAHKVSFPAIGIGSGVLGVRPPLGPSPLPSPSILDVFHSLFLPLDINRVSSLRPTYRHPFGRPSLTHFLGEFPGLGLALVPNVVVPEAEQRCTWSRKLDPNFCTGRGRTSDLDI